MQNNIFSGLFVGHNLVIIPKVDSTNNFLKQSLSNSTPLPEGTVIMAEAQYAGRGQQQQGWHAEPGMNLTFSILFKPFFLPIRRQFDLVRAISIGVTEVIKSIVGADVRIKWPNDIYFQDRKLGGILIENIIQGSQIKNAIVGIGLNVNQTIFPDNLPNPISIKEILQKEYDLKSLIAELCNGIEPYYLLLKAGNTALIQSAYLNNLYRLGEMHRFKVNDQVLLGMITGVSPEGLLQVKTGGEIREYDLKSIKFLF